MKKILVVRETGEFSRMLAENNFEVINLPLIETKELEDLSDFEKKIISSENYDGIFLTSEKAARILAKKLLEKGTNFNGKIYVLGNRGFEILNNKNFNLVFFDSANTAREMLQRIPSEDLTNKRFLYARGDKSLRIVPEFLSNFSKVDEAIVYETKEIIISTDKIIFLREAIMKNEIAAACFFSPSGAKNFIKQFGAEVLHQTKIAAIGKTTAEFFERRNLKAALVSSKSNAENFAEELIEYLGKI